MISPRPLPELTAYRKARKLSRRALGEILGVTETTVWRWEAGQRRPDREFVPALAEMTGVPAAELMGVA